MSSAKSTPKTSSKQKPLKFVVGSKTINEIPGPVLATFGDFPALESIDPSGEDPLLFDTYTIEAKKLLTAKNANANDNNIFNQQYVLKGETSTTEYYSSTQNSKRANQSKYLIGIFDPSTNEVELVPTPGVFVMEQAQKNVKLFFETPEEDNRKRSARSLQVFGATGARNLSKRMTLDSLHEGSGNVTEGMVDDLKQRLAETAESLQEEPKMTYFNELPSPNSTTRDVTEVYDPLNIIPETVWPAIPRITVAVNEQVVVEKHKMSPILLKLLKHSHFKNPVNLATKILKERLVVYTALLATLHTAPRTMYLTSYSNHRQLNRAIVEHMFGAFTTPVQDGFKITKSGLYRAAIFGGVSLLLAFDLSLDNELLKDFGQLFTLSPEEVKVVFQRIGCTVNKTGVQLVQPWKVWADAARHRETFDVQLIKAKKRAMEREKANSNKEAQEAEEGAEDADPNAMNLEDEEPAQEEATMDDNDDDFVSGVKGGSEKKRSRKSVGEKPKEDPLNKKKKM